MPFFSIITINLNNVAGLRKTIHSVIEQSCRDFEFIIIDGDSSDGSVEVIKTFESKITYWISEIDKGIYNAMNKGIARAKGDYFLFLNSGDLLFDNEVLQKVANTYPKEDLVTGNILFEKRNGELIENQLPEKMSKYFLLSNTLYHPITFIRREVFAKYGHYDENYRITGDYEFFLQMVSKGDFTYKHIDTIITVFDSTGISSLQEFRKLLKKERLHAQKKYFNPVLLTAYRFYRFVVFVVKKIIGREE